MGGAAAAEPIKVGDTMEGVRNARYCEIIPIVRDGLHLVATVYNTLGHNDCPAKIWAGITEDAMKQRFGALMVLMNGPRFFIMDEITASGASASGKTIDVDGMELTARASIDPRPVRPPARALSRDHHRPRHGLSLQGVEPGVPARRTRRQPLGHAGLRADRRQDPDL
jgi:hypothetical protein